METPERLRYNRGLPFRRPSTGAAIHPARVAKLVDAPGLGPDASNGVGVRVPSLAPKYPYKSTNYIFVLAKI